ncbi:MAG: FKBP-type peptidyl-prolyl cis-trans isomerase [Bacteroidales bacterium]
MMLRENPARIVILSFIAIAMVTASCMKDNTDELKAKEEKLLSNYLLTKNITAEPRPSGLYYIPSREGSGDLPVEGDLVLVNYNMKNLSDRVLYTTSYSTAVANSLSTSGRPFGPERWIIKLNNPLLKGFMEGMSLMRDSGRAFLITPSDLAFKQYGYPGIADPFETLVWDVEMVKVVKNPVAYEKALITAYLDTIAQDYDSTADGIIKILDKPGTGDLPATDDEVAVQFKLYTIEGYKISEITKDYVYTIGNSTGFITGWDKAMRMMRLGEECRIILPYEEAYGAEGYKDIPPYETIVYQFERTK